MGGWKVNQTYIQHAWNFVAGFVKSVRGDKSALARAFAVRGPQMTERYRDVLATQLLHNDPQGKAQVSYVYRYQLMCASI
jgi:hypothetical protein